MRFEPPLRVAAVSVLSCAGDAAASWRALTSRQNDSDPRPRLVSSIDISAVPPRQRRRMGRLSRLLMGVARDALDRAHALGRPDIGLVVGTGLGALDQTAAFLEQMRDSVAGSPALFAGSVMNVATGHVSLVLDLRGYNTTINHHAASGELAILAGAQALCAGRAPAMLTCGVDALEERSLVAHARVEGERARGLLDAPPGEQAAALLLEPLGDQARGVVLVAAASGRDALARCAACADATPTLLLEDAEAAAADLPAQLTSLVRLCSARPVGRCLSAGALRAAAAVVAIERGEHSSVLLRARSGVREVALLFERAAAIE